MKLDSLIYDGEYYYSVGSQRETILLDEDEDYYYTTTSTEYGLFKLDSNFEVVWFEEIDESSYDFNYDKGGFAGATSFSRESYIDFTPNGDIVFSYNYQSNNSVKIYKYDKQGNQIYKKDLGGTDFSSTWYSDEVISLVATEDNGVIAVGSIQSSNLIDRLGYDDAFYLKQTN